uniref:Uncharacterized protein n=1 Tax=Tanacetum cinerariifolium TaxID=118510 RepID=A0A699S8B3_TANCI|nr:hypothetical protein [Tanacetum cinerariifolium]
MFIKTKPVSTEIQHLVTEGLLAESNQHALLESMGGGEASTANLSFPHEAYFMQLNDVAEGKPLAAAYPTGTRVLLTDGRNQVYSAAEVNQGEPKARPVHFEEREHLQPMLEGIERFSAKNSPARMMYKDLEMRLLRIPALYITAVWLHNEQKDIELLMPVGSVSPPLEAYRVYNGASFLRTIQQAAAERLAQFKEEKYDR